MNYEILKGLTPPFGREPRRTTLPAMIELARKMRVGDAVVLKSCEANVLRIVLAAMGYRCLTDAWRSTDKGKLLAFKLHPPEIDYQI